MDADRTGRVLVRAQRGPEGLERLDRGRRPGRGRVPVERVLAVDQPQVLERRRGPDEVIRVDDRGSLLREEIVRAAGRRLEVDHAAVAVPDQVVRARCAGSAGHRVESLVERRAGEHATEDRVEGHAGSPDIEARLERVRREPDARLVRAALRPQPRLDDGHEPRTVVGSAREHHAGVAHRGLPVPGLGDPYATVIETSPDRRALLRRGLGRGLGRTGVEAEHDLGPQVHRQDVLGLHAGSFGDPLQLGQELDVVGVDRVDEGGGSAADLGPGEPRVVGEDALVDLDRAVDPVGGS